MLVGEWILRVLRRSVGRGRRVVGSVFDRLSLGLQIPVSDPLKRGLYEAKKGRLILRARLARYQERRCVLDGYFLLQRPMTLPCGSPMVPQ